MNYQEYVAELEKRGDFSPRLCWSCNKKQDPYYFHNDLLACDDCTLSPKEREKLNARMAAIIFGANIEEELE